MGLHASSSFYTGLLTLLCVWIFLLTYLIFTIGSQHLYTHATWYVHVELESYTIYELLMCIEISLYEAQQEKKTFWYLFSFIILSLVHSQYITMVFAENKYQHIMRKFSLYYKIIIFSLCSYSAVMLN